MRTVNVTYHREDDGWWAESDDVPGFSALADDLEEVRRRVRTGLRFHFDDDEDLDLREEWGPDQNQIEWSGVAVQVVTSSAGVGSITAAGALPLSFFRGRYRAAS